MELEFRRIKDRPQYEISNDGQVVSHCLKNGVLNSSKDSSGYKTVSLSDGNSSKTYRVHRLVAIHFILNPEGKPCVNHKDGNKFNNSVDNLEWCTYSENSKHASDTLIRKYKPVVAIDVNGNEAKFNTMRQAAQWLNISYTGIGNCLSGITKTSGGYKWRTN